VFSSDQTTSALTWGNAWTSATTTSSATATAGAVTSGSIVAGGSALGTAPTVNQTYGSASSFAWTLSSTSSSGTLTSAAITSGAELTGDLKFTSAGTGGATIDQSLASVTGGTLTLEAQSLQGLLNSTYGTGGDADYAVTVTGGDELQISLGASASADQITGLGSATTSTTDQAAPNGFTVTGITSGDWLNGSITLGASGTGSLLTSSVSLAGVNQADLASVVGQDLNGTSNANPDFSVTYGTGTLTVSLTTHAAADGINGVTGTGSSVAQSAATSGTITFAANDTLGGGFSITPTKNGAAGTAVNINLAGVNTGSSSVTTSNSAVVAAVNQQLGTALAADYNVSYANNVLTIGVSTAGQTAGYDAVTLANGTTANSGPGALSQGTVAQSNVATVNTAMGSFSLTPTGSSTTAITVSLAGLSPTGVGNANLLTGVQAQLNAAATGDYVVSYDSTSDATSGNLTIGLTSAGVAAGLTGFTVAEASQAAASQETPIAGGVNIYTSDGTSTGSQNYNVTVGNLSDTSVGTSAGSSVMGTQVSVTVSGTAATGGIVAGAGQGTSLTGTTLSTQASSEAALQTVDNAINAVAYQRGQVGANINTLTAASNIASSQMTNITSAQNTITATDYASATSNMSKYEILTQTGISALAQANSTQQMVTKLLQ
jgi:flagellin